MYLLICRSCAIKLGKLKEYDDSMSGNWEALCDICHEEGGVMDVDVGRRRTVKKHYCRICVTCARKLKKLKEYKNSPLDGGLGNCKICGATTYLKHIYVKPREIYDTFPQKSKVFN